MPELNRSLVVIPARGGSKRLPRKNIIDLAGKPLIAHTIEAALKCECFGRVMVTTAAEMFLTPKYRVGSLRRFRNMTVNAFLETVLLGPDAFTQGFIAVELQVFHVVFPHVRDRSYAAILFGGLGLGFWYVWRWYITRV